ncbi:polyketide cyclase/dehydrase/lipid transport protein [Branchiibius hedensis]|uniref:Polyketide cyclase / dehydrase and lipid transport n=1 Tax=Branchiibius hedensis TaxID=672460 RepID=A0A2Y8ZTQ3_9MICO|nr:SRPBCC family protein [Branchiibius hedensis]PWJ24833.1 polyketide cyclase/dehydrase/lipid transport protein [Branchiibius hedensis]SSA33649.1 Polyketide cyclase / dehydrase and lipid transport [Branchiibius hedensis]
MSDSTRASVVIEAPSATVLDVIADFEEYPAWAEQVKRATVLEEDEGGWPIQVEFVLDAGVIKDTYVLNYDWQVDEAGEGVVRWTLERSSLLKSMDGSYTIRSTPEGTDVVYELSVAVTIPVVSMLRRKAERMIIDTALSGLKQRVESN